MRKKHLLLIFLLSSSLAANEVVFFDELVKKNGKYVLESTGELFSGTSVELRGDIKDKDSSAFRSEINFIDGQQSQSSLWHINSNIKIHETNFKNGQQDGVQTLRRTDGSLMHQGTWKGGKRNGPMTSYHPNGEVSYKAMRKDGMAVGVDECFEMGGFSSQCTAAKKSGDFSLLHPSRESKERLNKFLVKRKKAPKYLQAEKLLDYSVDKEHYFGRQKKGILFVNCDESIHARDNNGEYLSVGDNKIYISRRDNMKDFSAASIVCTNDDVAVISTSYFHKGNIRISRYTLAGDLIGNFTYKLSRGYPYKPVVYLKESDTDYIVGIQEWGAGITETDYYFRLPK